LIWAISVLSVATTPSTIRQRAGLCFADASLGRAPELGKQLRGFLAAGVALAFEEGAEALIAQAARVDRARVALKERE
jgi:hypothetical protein